MSDSDSVEEIRERKRRELAEQTGDEQRPTAPDEPIHVGDESEFSEVVEEYGAVLVDFYADWCGPCKQLEPIVEQVAAETDGAVAKVDVDQHQGLAREFGVRGVPTMVLFDDGEQVEQVVGVRGPDALIDLVSRHA
jgi:thioredoxin 1